MTVYSAIIVVLGNAAVAHWEESPPSILDVAQLDRGIATMADGVLLAKSIRVEYAIVRAEQFSEAKYGHRMAGFRIVVARRDRDVFVRVSETSRGPSHSQTESVRTVIYRDRICAELLTDPARRGGTVIIGAEATSHVWDWWEYTDNLFLNVYEFLPRPQDGFPTPPPSWRQPFLPRCLRDNGSGYRVRPAQEKVDGFWCHVLERPGLDRIWIDPAHGFAIRRRELHWGAGLPLSTSVRNSDWRPAKPGLWLPWRQNVERYADPKLEERRFWGELVNRRTIEVNSIDFDTLTDESFGLDVPDGAVVYDNVRRLQYVKQSPDSPPFEAALAFAATELGRSVFRERLFLAIGVFAGLLVVIMLVRRVRQMRRSGN